MTSETPESGIAGPQLHILSYVGNWNSASRGCRLAAFVALVYGIACISAAVPLTLWLGFETYRIAKQLSTPPAIFIMPPAFVGGGGPFVFPAPPPPVARPPWYAPTILRMSLRSVYSRYQPWILLLPFLLVGSFLIFLQAGMRRGRRRPLILGGIAFWISIIPAMLATAGVCLICLSAAGIAYPGHQELRSALWGLLLFPVGVLLTLVFKDLSALCFWNARHFGLEKPKIEFLTGRVAPTTD